MLLAGVVTYLQIREVDDLNGTPNGRYALPAMVYIGLAGTVYNF